MSEIEVPIEKVQEDIHHMSHGHSHPMMNIAALLSALLAACAAVAALCAGHLANEAMIEQIQSSDHWSYFQAKGIKLAIAEFRQQADNSEALATKIETYKKEQADIKILAEEKEHHSRLQLERHEKLAAAVTFFQIAIALTAIAVLARKRRFLWLASGLGVVGMGFMVFSLL